MHLDAFERLVREEPTVASKMMALLSKRLAFYADRVADTASKDVTGRLSNLILHLAESEGLGGHEGYRLATRYTHQQLGEMIGAKRVAVTRALGELRETGIVGLEHRHLRVKNVGALERAAGR